MNQNLTKKKCFLCGKELFTATPVCEQCGKQSAQKEASDTSRIKAMVERVKLIEPSAISKETEIPLYTVKWYLDKGKLSAGPAKKPGDAKPAGITITDSVYGDTMWIFAQGRVDSQNAMELQGHINKMIAMGWRNFILDLSKISFFSSNGIRVVLTAYKTLHETGSFKIANPSENVINVLGMVALDKMLLQ